jgi:hypothetical protein
VIGGQAGLRDTSGDRRRGARIGAQAGVVGDVPAGETWSGYPARPHREALRAQAALFKLLRPAASRDASRRPIGWRRRIVSLRTCPSRDVDDRARGLADGHRAAPRRAVCCLVPAGAERQRDLLRAERPAGRADDSGASRRGGRDAASDAAGQGAEALHTVEHVLAAVGRTASTTSKSRWTRPEPPIMDGSAAPFSGAGGGGAGAPNGGACRGAGVAAVRCAWKTASRWYEAEPSLELELDVRIAFPHPLIGTQVGGITSRRRVCPRAGRRAPSDLCTRSRRSRPGLIQGASVDNAMVLDADGLRSGPALVGRVRAPQGAGLCRRPGARRSARSRPHRCSSPESSRGRCVCPGADSHRGAGVAVYECRRHHEGAAAPLSVPARRSHPRDRGGQAHCRPQERHDQRAVLSGALSRGTRSCRAC